MASDAETAEHLQGRILGARKGEVAAAVITTRRALAHPVSVGQWIAGILQTSHLLERGPEEQDIWGMGIGVLSLIWSDSRLK